MFTKSARYYDALYAFKDYGAAAAALRAHVRDRHANAASLLDVGCGTGRHLQELHGDYQVEGLDLSPELLQVARDRLGPDVPLHQADMADFALGRRFDVVTCLFSAVAYVRTHENLRRAVRCMADHLNPGGLLLIEPWFSPERYWVGRITANFVDEPDLKIAWMYVSERRGDVSVLPIHYMVGTTGGVEEFREEHQLGLWTHEEYMAALSDAGLTEVAHDAAGFFGRGLYSGRDAALWYDARV